MKGKEDIWENENWTQNEVAEYFRVVPGTIKNWRERGLLSYWRAPGSTTVLFYRDDIKDFRDKHTFTKKGDDKPKVEIKKVKPSVSSKKEIWEII
jgi:hypothetical protein